MRPYGLPRAARSKCSRRSQEGEQPSMSDDQHNGQSRYDGHSQHNGQNRYDGQQDYGRSYDSEPYGQQQYGVPRPGRPSEPYQQQYQPQAPQQQHYQQQPYQEPSDGQDAQTWEGQTWDTQYQPQVQYRQPQSQPPQPAAADTAYLPQQSGAYPLPPEVPTPGQQPYVPPAASAPAPAPGPAAAPAAPAADSYSSPTTMGNARITDAQRARAEGRSPIIPPGIQPAGLTAVLALLLAGGAAVGPWALVVPLVILQAVTAAGWFRLNGMWPARQGIALAFAGALVADVAVLAVGDDHALAAILGTLGAWVLLTVVLQLRSYAGADERMQGLMATVASAALAIIATGNLAAVPDAVTVGALAVAAATVARALPLPGIVSIVVALAAGAGAGVAAGGLTDIGGQGALLGLGAGVCALIGLRVASYDYPSRFVHMTAGVALPLTVAVPAIYLLGRAL
ncbi:FUSC family protein [Streptomyces sp. NPDC060366]|uniref:FUSC family protein n=1 Tax=Streptomyces sp. NPDC060366 TaxID=3347105 RepID=UPI003651BF2E